MNTKLPIIIDTREQHPLQFDMTRCEVKRHKLDAGDYSLSGFEDKVAIERKTLEDFVRTVIHERDRFERELLRMKDFRAACVVVEADFDHVLKGLYRSQAFSGQVAARVLDIYVDHNIPVFFLSHRRGVTKFTEGFLRRIYQEEQS